MRKLQVSTTVAGLFLLAMVIFGMLVYYNYVGFGVYQQYKQIINFAAIFSVMIVLVYIGAIAGNSATTEERKAARKAPLTAQDLERELLETSRDYHEFLSNSEEYHIITGKRSPRKVQPKNHMEKLKEKSMFDSIDDLD